MTNFDTVEDEVDRARETLRSRVEDWIVLIEKENTPLSQVADDINLLFLQMEAGEAKFFFEILDQNSLAKWFPNDIEGVPEKIKFDYLALEKNKNREVKVD